MPIMLRAIMLAAAIATSACAPGSPGDFKSTEFVKSKGTPEMDLAKCKIEVSDKTKPGVLGLLTSAERVENCMVAKGYIRSK